MQTQQTLLVVDDEADVRYSFKRIFGGDPVTLEFAASGEEALLSIPKLKPDLVLMDIRMGGASGLETLQRLRKSDARTPVIIMTAYGSTQAAIEAMKHGAYDYLLKPFDVPKLKEIVVAALRVSRDMRAKVSFEPLLGTEEHDQEIIGRSAGMQEVYKLIGQLSRSDVTALITGESGTGKELVARAIYQHGQRAEKTFLAVNCAAIPEALLESELFGHEKGSFTGASHQRIGKFEQCDGGTIFLDEIGELSLATQAKMLRVLQSGTFERVGGNQSVKVNVRVIAATNKPLESSVSKKEFREDLFYRLNVVRIHLPPLRERKGDVALLVEYFLNKHGGRGRALQSAAIEALEAHGWPGNVRELENVIQRTLVVGKAVAIRAEDVSAALSGAGRSVSGVQAGDVDFQELARQIFRWARSNPKLKLIPAMERELVVAALQEVNGNQVQAAKLLGITRATLRKRVDRFGIQHQLKVS